MTRIVVGAVVGGLLTACVPSDLNRECPLVKKSADGGRALIHQPEIAALVGSNKDFVSQGVTECGDDDFCVRDSNMVFATDHDSGVILDVPAMGYCSRPCRQGQSCPSYDSALDTGSTRLVCRALLLTPETLVSAELPGLTDPYLCARGADGG